MYTSCAEPHSPPAQQHSWGMFTSTSESLDLQGPTRHAVSPSSHSAWRPVPGPRPCPVQSCSTAPLSWCPQAQTTRGAPADPPVGKVKAPNKETKVRLAFECGDAGFEETEFLSLWLSLSFPCALPEDRHLAAAPPSPRARGSRTVHPLQGEGRGPCRVLGATASERLHALLTGPLAPGEAGLGKVTGKGVRSMHLRPSRGHSCCPPGPPKQNYPTEGWHFKAASHIPTST